MKAPLEFHLLIDKLLSAPFDSSNGPAEPGVPEGYAATPVPETAGCLVKQPNAAPRILPLGSDVAAPGLVLVPAVRRRGGARLLVLSADGTPVHVNGVPTPGATVLREGDLVRWGGLSCFVTLFNAPQVGAPPAASIGKPCPVCRVPFTATSRCYTCACTTPFHCEEDGEDALQCTQLQSECPVCGRPVRMESGYTSLPASLEVTDDA
jgi:hypothetical protein